MNSTWIPLTEYSSKYQVSISTLRRRIKSEEIKYQLHDGRYLIFDEPQKHRPSQQAASPSLKGKIAETESTDFSSEESVVNTGIKSSDHINRADDEPILVVASRLLTELKKAYSQILQEKQEQIMKLKQELADLKTLVRVLETENEKLSKK